MTHTTNLVNHQNAQAKRHAQKENRSARVDKHVLIDKLLDLFRQHRIWGIRDLKIKVNQPESYLKDVLLEIAYQHNKGDFNSKYELREEYKVTDVMLQNPTNEGSAPDVDGGSDVDTKSGIDGEDDDDFEDVDADG